VKITVYATTRFEGFHRWPDAPAEVAFLRDRHRHEFHVKAYRTVTHDNRDIEFILLKRHIAQVISLTQSDAYCKANDVDIETWSCEQWAHHLLEVCDLSKCEVSEDSENGAIVEVDNV
jgi:hypothetical protein